MKIIRDLGTSHAWTLHEARLSDGRRAFVKTGAPGLRTPATVASSSTAGSGAGGAGFTAEAAGLRWLAEPKAVAVPEVIDADRDLLVLEWIETGPATAAAAERFGRELAALHGAGAPEFGAPWPGFIAELPMDNAPAPDWPSFYVSRRVLPFVRLARDSGQLSPADVELIEEACAYIPEVSGPAEPPSRIHGDLWNGNLLWSAAPSQGVSRVVLIDPAAHGGHRETDLAMLALFGAPHLGTIRGAYREAAPLNDGWRERVPLHQLHPLAVHVCLYGEAYRGSLLTAASEVLAL
ncbi:fructosamine kinase family protein [Planotetraspora sp. A-T 1434]|uniref:fructosamine kinase family protein n=1 Tax=Planotetraspora sp. A-T 1434 TaxID=2979219 RepID=UPI0021C0B617|nr:fructosamine kinase family protein [Planotetraspora sp. A-T 1434]MCT9931217.1 fructosamine kinase family protein [Planotetraspora sp. A-T 1434]